MALEKVLTYYFLKPLVEVASLIQTNLPDSIGVYGGTKYIFIFHKLLYISIFKQILNFF